MKQHFVIKVDIDTEQDGITGFYQGEDEVLIRKDVFNDPRVADLPNKLAMFLAHEFGHIIAYKVGLPAAKKDPRMDLFAVSKDYKKDIFQAEVEAWDVAEMMFSTQSARKAALKTYTPLALKIYKRLPAKT